MSSANGPKLSVEDLLRRVREEAARRRGGMAHPDGVGNPQGSTGMSADEELRPFADLQLEPGLESKTDGYEIEDFTRLQHAQFVNAAYRALLGREADPPGFQHFMDRLERGESKVFVLGHIRFSPEGRRRGVAIRGLAMRFAFERTCQIPIAGYLIRFLFTLARLPHLVEQMRRIENHTAGRLAALNDHTSAADRALHKALTHWSSSQREAVRRIEDTARQTVELGIWRTSAEQQLANVTDAQTDQRESQRALAESVAAHRAEQGAVNQMRD